MAETAKARKNWEEVCFREAKIDITKTLECIKSCNKTSKKGRVNRSDMFQMVLIRHDYGNQDAIKEEKDKHRLKFRKS